LTSKILYIVRHGQALHNPRAEAAKAKGCSMEEFFELMRQDDVLDAELTPLGRDQAKRCFHSYFAADRFHHEKSTRRSPKVDLIVSSPLSRAIETANLVYPTTSSTPVPKICIEDFREVNGELLNGKRRSKTELLHLYPSWDFDMLETDDDVLWTPEMEAFEAAAERGYRGLAFLLLKRPEERILLVSHGGILRYTMNQHPLVHLDDARSDDKRQNGKTIESRFDNCEVRKYQLSWKDHDGVGDVGRRPILLTQLDY